MSDPKSPRKPFGERDEGERSLPFGARPPRRSDSSSNQTPPTAPYPERPKAAPPPRDPSTPVPTAPYPWAESEDDNAPAPAEKLAPPEPEDRDAAALSWDELIHDVSGDESPPTPKLVGEDEAFGEKQEETPTLTFGELEAKVAEREAEAADASLLGRVPSLLKQQRRKRTAIQARSYVAEVDKASAISTPLRLRWGVMLRSAGVMAGIAALVATVLTWWTPGSFLPLQAQGQLALALATQTGPRLGAAPASDPAHTIGIVSGHRGINPSSGLPDPGAVCSDGLTEQKVNEAIATQVVAALQSEGYSVDLLDEFDPRLAGYRALAVVSIHADSCEYVNDDATGFKVASFAASQAPEADQRLVSCLIDRYTAATGLRLHQSVTFDMTDYHNFREIDAATPGAIIEVGFLYLDRDFLTNRSGDAARGVTDGINCFIRHELPAAGSNTLTPAAETPNPPSETPTQIP